MYVKSKKKILSAVAIMMIISSLFIVLSMVFITDAKADIDKEKSFYLSEVSQKVAELVDAKVHSSFNALSAVATVIGEKLFNFNEDKEEIQKIILSETNRIEFFRMGIILCGSLKNNEFIKDTYKDRTSKLYSFVGNSDEIIDVSERDYAHKAMKGQSIASATINTISTDATPKEIVVVAVPIFYQSQILGVFFGAEDARNIQKLMKVPAFSEKSHQLIINSEGMLMYRDDVWQIKNIFEIIEKDNVKYDKSSWFKFRKEMQKNAVGVATTVSIDNIEYDIVCHKLKTSDLYIVNIIDSSTLLQSSLNLYPRVIGIASILVLVVVMSCFYIFTLLKKNNDKLLNIAYKDPVTGFRNWEKFKLETNELLTEKKSINYCLVSCDIDKFKIVNDMYGYKKGDDMLKFVARVIHQGINRNETFARVTADVFNILMEYRTDLQITERLRDMAERIGTYCENFNLVLTFGIFVIEDKALDLSHMSDRASLAKVAIKGGSQSTWAFFNNKLREQIIEEKEFENDMQSAMDKNEFIVYLQPKFSFKTNKIVGAEALVRWQHPKKGLVSPMQFIPLFEKNGCIKCLDMYMFEKVCKLLERWRSEGKGMQNMSISVNFSRKHLSVGVDSDKLKDMCKQYGVPTKLIEIEITESAVIEDLEELRKILFVLKEIGFRISIDDFGSGYSSLNSLKDIPADIIKLDKEFLTNTTDTKKGREILHCLIGMTKILGMITVAEGVEEKAQAVFLKNSECDVAQGYFYAKPMPISEFEKLVELNYSHTNHEDPYATL